MGSYQPSTQAERQAMLEAIGCQSVDDLYAQVPPEMRLDHLDPVSYTHLTLPTT